MSGENELDGGVIVTVDDGEELDTKKEKNGGDDLDKGGGDDKSLRRTNDDDDDHDDKDKKEETEEEILARRREERKERKKRRDEAIKRDKTELKFLRDQNDLLERRIAAVEGSTRSTSLAQVDQGITQARQEIAQAERVLAAATKANNGEDMVKAMRARDASMERLRRLTYVKERVAEDGQHRQVHDQQNQQEAPQLSESVKNHAQSFIKDHAWYNPRGGDEDSAIVLAIDSTLMREGYDPESEDYWDELRDRVKERLPNRFLNGDGDGGSRGGPQLGSGRSQRKATKKGEVFISAERKQALIDAGVWDDPKLRARYVKRYQEYDKLHKQDR